MMNKKKIITVLLLIAIVLLFAWYFYANMSDFKVLLSISPVFLGLVLLGHFISILTNGFFIKGIFHANKLEMTVSQSVKASFISAIGNFFFPVGTGAAAQAKYLKSSFNFNYKRFLSAFSGNYIIVFLVNGLFGLMALLALQGRASDGVFYTLLVVFLGMLLPNLYFAIAGVPVGLTSLFRSSKNRFMQKVGSILVEVINGWNFVTKNKTAMRTLISVTIINFLASMLISYAAITSIGVVVDFWALVMYSSLGAVTLLLNITPGSIGIREGVFIFTASLIGLTTSEVVAVAIIDRLARFFVLLIGLWLFKDYIRGSKRKIDILL